MTFPQQDVIEYYKNKFNEGQSVEYKYAEEWYFGKIKGIALEHTYTYYIVEIDRSKPLPKDFDIYKYSCISISSNFLRGV